MSPPRLLNDVLTSSIASLRNFHEFLPSVVPIRVRQLAESTNQRLSLFGFTASTQPQAMSAAPPAIPITNFTAEKECAVQQGRQNPNQYPCYKFAAAKPKPAAFLNACIYLQHVHLFTPSAHIEIWHIYLQSKSQSTMIGFPYSSSFHSHACGTFAQTTMPESKCVVPERID